MGVFVLLFPGVLLLLLVLLLLVGVDEEGIGAVLFAAMIFLILRGIVRIVFFIFSSHNCRDLLRVFVIHERGDDLTMKMKEKITQGHS